MEALARLVTSSSLEAPPQRQDMELWRHPILRPLRRRRSAVVGAQAMPKCYFVLFPAAVFGSESEVEGSGDRGERPISGGGVVQQAVRMDCGT